MDVSVWLRSEATILPANLARVSNTTVSSTTALKGIVRLLGLVSPREEQSNMAIGTASAGAKSANKVSGLEVFPCDLLPDSREVNGRVSWSRSVEGHGYEARAIGAVFGTLWVWVVTRHGVWDVAVDPVLAAGDDFLASDLAVRCRVAGSAGFALGLYNSASGARLHIVVCNIAAIGCLVPEVVPFDGFANGLASNLNIVPFLVRLDNFVAGCWT